jgi:hypothetical protein
MATCECGLKRNRMLLYLGPWFTFRFADDRIIPRFHLEGVEVGSPVPVFKINPATGERLGLLSKATVGEDGWVDLAEPIIVKAGDAFIAVTLVSPEGRSKSSSPTWKDRRNDARKSPAMVSR